jgi:hypothetical protein
MARRAGKCSSIPYTFLCRFFADSHLRMADRRLLIDDDPKPRACNANRAARMAMPTWMIAPKRLSIGR